LNQLKSTNVNLASSILFSSFRPTSHQKIMVVRGCVSHYNGTTIHIGVTSIVEIRYEKSEDRAAVRRVRQQAFRRSTEADLVERLHDANKAPIAIVAALNGKAVGHILFSPVLLKPPQPHFNAVGLAPVGVLPEYQNQGIGSRLISEGLKAYREASYDAVVVLGDPAYHSRFGFSCARDCGLSNVYNADEHFMVVALKEGVLDGVSGTVKYQSEFQEAGC
jgi:putative acetyltransferase